MATVWLISLNRLLKVTGVPVYDYVLVPHKLGYTFRLRLRRCGCQWHAQQYFYPGSALTQVPSWECSPICLLLQQYTFVCECVWMHGDRRIAVLAGCKPSQKKEKTTMHCSFRERPCLESDGKISCCLVTTAYTCAQKYTHAHVPHCHTYLHLHTKDRRQK